MPRPAGPTRSARSTLKQRSAKAFRWVHIYLSMLGFAALMFFAFTGITLNHPSWFGASEAQITDSAGELPKQLLSSLLDAEPESAQRAGLEAALAAYLKETHSLRGKASEFQADEFDLFVVFKSPGYSADVFGDSASGKYTVTEADSGTVALLNDLHKGRDSGLPWRWVIDVSAVLMMVLSLSGFGLLFYIKRRRTKGLWTALVGTLLLMVVWYFWVP